MPNLYINIAPKEDEDIALDQYSSETDKQPLIGAEPSRPMLAAEVHPPPRSLIPHSIINK